jgi:UDP-N-acetylmuramate--alanine ligase
MAARERNVPVVPRAIMLAELLRLRQGIAIAGTHGKTTTTSLIASILAEAGMDPTFVIGGRLEAAGSHAKLGRGEFIVVEADESDASFLYLQPVLAVVTNIDADHMETYGHDFSKLKQAFVEFVQHLPFYGMAVLCVDDARVREIMPVITKPVTTYGLSDTAQVRATDIRHDEGKMFFTALVGVNGKTRKLNIMLNLPGLHNVQNALAAIAVCNEVGLPDAAIVRALASFGGVDRRFQRYGEVQLGGNGNRGDGSFTLIDDYGHHPVEMAATIAAARGAFPGRRLVLAFQPHRYTRTRDLFEDFVKVLSTVDVLLLTEVYPAGEAPLIAADSKSLARALRVQGKVEPIFAETVDELAPSIRGVAQNNDVVLVMGAGTVGVVAPILLTGNQN